MERKRNKNMNKKNFFLSFIIQREMISCITPSLDHSTINITNDMYTKKYFIQFNK
jgi:hypothetical protein